MVNQEQIRKRAWKYFWEQKRQEIKNWWNENKEFFQVMGICLSLSLGFLSMIFYPKIATPIIITIFVLWLGLKIFKWLKSNWNKAMGRAEADLKLLKGGNNINE